MMNLKQRIRRSRVQTTLAALMAILIPSLAGALDNGDFEAAISPSTGWDSTP